MVKSKLLTAICLLGLASLSSATYAQTLGGAPTTWQGEMDLLTAGAAASVVLHQKCKGSESAREADGAAQARLTNATRALEAKGVSATAVWDYASDAYRMKVRAMTMANQDLGCAELARLVNLAKGTGFRVPG